MSTSNANVQSPSDRRSAEAQLRALIAKFTPASAQRSLISSARRSLRTRLPTAHEIAYEYRDCFVISYSPSDRGYEGVLAIRGDVDGVKLYFNQGKTLPDPEKLLRGAANARWILLEGTSRFASTGVASLIEQAITRNRVPFAGTGHGQVIVRSTATKKRPVKQRTTTKPISKKHRG